MSVFGAREDGKKSSTHFMLKSKLLYDVKHTRVSSSRLDSISAHTMCGIYVYEKCISTTTTRHRRQHTLDVKHCIALAKKKK